jgi:hypothetical protein
VSGERAAVKGRRIKINRRRLAAFCLLVVAIPLAFAAPRWPYVAVGIPGSDLLRAAPEVDSPGATVPLSGRFVAARLRDDGVLAVALARQGGGLDLVAAWPDGRSIRTVAGVEGDPAIVTAGYEEFYAWVPSVSSRPSGGILYSLPIARLGAGPGTTSEPAWHREFDRQVLLIVPLPGAVALLTGDSRGIPDVCAVLDAASGKTLWEDANPGGLWTALDGAALAGAVALGGAAPKEASLGALVRLRGAQAGLLFERPVKEGPPYVLSLSPTGRFLLAISHKRLHLWNSEGNEQWSRAFPAVAVTGATVSAEGLSLVATRQNILALDQRGTVVKRWRGPALSAWALDDARGLLLCVLNGGAALLRANGQPLAVVRWRGQTQGAFVDLEGKALWRVIDGALEKYSLPNL